MPYRRRQWGCKASRTRRGARPPRTIDRAKAPRLRVTTGKVSQSLVEMRGCSRFRQPSAAAIAMCSDRSPEKRNPWALQFFGPRAGVNPPSSIPRATESRERGLPEGNDREKSARSKKRKLTPELTGDSDLANARAHYTSTVRL